VIASKEGSRSGNIEIISQHDEKNIYLCFQRTDTKTKKLDFIFKRITVLHQDAANLNTLDSLSDDL
jgi:hypothetical protein